MLRPSKHTDLNTCILNVGSLILKQLAKYGPTKYDDIVMNLKEELGDNARFQVGPSLNLLYLLGLIEYDQNSDTVFRESNSIGEKLSEN
jgi:hypothetical protein